MDATTMNKLTMTLAGAARYLNAKRATLVLYVSRGELCAMLIDGRYLFHQPHLDSFVKEQAEKQAADIRRAREASGPPEGHEQPASPGKSSRKKRGAQREDVLSRHKPECATACANPAALSEAQPDLPGLGPDLQQQKEPR
jgi:hypothetical protein